MLVLCAWSNVLELLLLLLLLLCFNVISMHMSSGPGLHEMLEHSQQQRFIFFGGKGGVGKTSVSAAVAVKCADQVILQRSHRG